MLARFSNTAALKPTEKTVAPNTFTFQLIGQRGVGKTVFLASMCARMNELDRIGLRSADAQTEAHMQQILKFIRTQGSYPPATDRNVPFSFDLYRKGMFLNRKPLCQFRWEDIPGESCKAWDGNFNRSLTHSSGGLVFVDASALLTDPGYGKSIDALIEMLIPVVNLVALNQLDYPIALVLTKCDLLGSMNPSTLNLLGERLSPLTGCLEQFDSRYRVFYSSMTIQPGERGQSSLVLGPGQPALLWLIEEIQSRQDVPILSRVMQWLGLAAKSKGRNGLGYLRT